MNSDVSLEQIARGRISASECHKIISPILKRGEISEVQKVYTVLRAWTWKAITERRRDDDLRSWYNLLRGVSSYLQGSHVGHAERIRVLYELIYESIHVVEVVPPSKDASCVDTASV